MKRLMIFTLSLFVCSVGLAPSASGNVADDYIGPLQPTSGPGGSDYCYDDDMVRVAQVRGRIGADANARIYSPDDDPERTAARCGLSGPRRVILFLHGGVGIWATDGPQLELIHHLVRRGYTVVYPETLWSVINDSSYGRLLAAIENAFDSLRGANGSEELSISIVSVSAGSMPALRLANEFYDRQVFDRSRLKALVTLDAAGANYYVLYHPQMPDDLSGIPSDITLLMIMSRETHDGKYSDGLRRCNRDWTPNDRVPLACTAWAIVNPAFKNTPQLSPFRKTVVMIPDDDRFGLVSDHESLPNAGEGELNAIDWYGYWKSTDIALGSAHGDPGYTKNVRNHEHFLFMGERSGVAANPMKVVYPSWPWSVFEPKSGLDYHF